MCDNTGAQPTPLSGWPPLATSRCEVQVASDEGQAWTRTAPLAGASAVPFAVDQQADHQLLKKHCSQASPRRFFAPADRRFASCTGDLARGSACRDANSMRAAMRQLLPASLQAPAVPWGDGRSALAAQAAPVAVKRLEALLCGSVAAAPSCDDVRRTPAHVCTPRGIARLLPVATVARLIDNSSEFAVVSEWELVDGASDAAASSDSGIGPAADGNAVHDGADRCRWSALEVCPWHSHGTATSWQQSPGSLESQAGTAHVGGNNEI